MALLRVKKGAAVGALYMVPSSRKPAVIGRDDSVEICLADNRSSRRHAAICLDHGRWIIQDLRSSNGTIVQGKKVPKALLRDGTSIQIGSTLLSFHAAEFAPPPPHEVGAAGSSQYSARALETTREEAGVSICRALLNNTDRSIRMDLLSKHRPLTGDSARLLEQALQEADNLSSAEILAVLSAEIGNGATSVLLDAGPPISGDIDELIAQPLAARIEVFRQLVAAVLERATWEGLRYPIGLPHILIDTAEHHDDSDAAMRVRVPAFDLGAFVAWQNRDFIHIPHYAAYLPPEMQSDSVENESRPLAGAMYNLGAIGYHLLTGQPPMGEGDVKTTLERHRTLQPAPADLVEPSLPKTLSELLERMLAKEPSARPGGRSEVLQSIPHAPPSERAARQDHVAARAAQARPAAPPPRRAPTPRPASLVAPQRQPASVVAEKPRPAAQPRRKTALEESDPVIPWYYRTLPLWILFWIGLFFVVRFLSREFFFSVGL